jgi:outer membrane protein assembly factor BamB
MHSKALRTPWLLLSLAALLLGCSKKEKDVEPPAELVKFQPLVEIDRAWSNNVGGDDKLRLALAPAVADGRVYAAGSEGDIYAFDLKSGKTLWRTKTKLPFSGGPGVGQGLVVVGSSNGEVEALDSATGTRRWKVKILGEVLAAPAVGASAVLVRAVDGRLVALALADGREIWQEQQAPPRLTLRGTAPPVVVGESVICGFDNGKVVAYSLQQGDQLWESAVSPSRGRTELERLNDIDATVHVSGNDVFVVGYQGRVAMIALDSGQIWWARDESSYRGFTLDDERLYVTNADSGVVALSRRDGSPVWDQKRLARRQLTAPALDGEAIVVADFEGYLHWLDRASGEFLGRTRAGGDRISNAPVSSDGYVIVQTDKGRVEAFRSRPRPGRGG